MRNSDKTLANSTAKVIDAAHEVNTAFDKMVQDANAGVGDSKEAVKAINDVRPRVIAKLQNGEIGVKSVNDVKRLVGDEIKKFSAPDNLNSAQKVEQEAYRQSYFKLRDLVSQAEPATKDLNEKISRGIDLQNLLERKFGRLETAEQAEASHAGVRSQKAKSLAVKAAVGAAGTGVAGLGVHKLIE